MTMINSQDYVICLKTQIKGIIASLKMASSLLYWSYSVPVDIIVQCIGVSAPVNIIVQCIGVSAPVDIIVR